MVTSIESATSSNSDACDGMLPQPLHTLDLMRTEPGLQLTWLDGDVVAWQPGRGIYGGNLTQQVSRLAGQRYRYESAGASAMRVAPLHLPDGQQSVMCQRLDLFALGALAEIRSLPTDVSPSVAWFGDMYRLAQELVGAGRALPQLGQLDSGRWIASWRPLRSDIDLLEPALVASMPPVVGAGGLTSPTVIIDAIVDRLARTMLEQSAWRSPHADNRRSESRAMKLVSKALAAQNGRFDAIPELEPDLHEIADQFELIGRRAAGEPVVRARLRLSLPDESADQGQAAWPLSLEVVDTDDRSKWCSAADVVQQTQRAVDLANGAQHLPIIQHQLDTAIADIAVVAPFLVEWLDQQERGIHIDQAALLLEAIELLDTVRIELVAPQRLTRRRTTTRATATPRDTSSASAGRFGATALVEWQVIVDNVPVPEHVLRRAALDGANLIEVGGRWVQVDRADARRALANLAEHRAQHGEVTALQLLQLAAELDEQNASAAALNELDDSYSHSDQAAITSSGWVNDLLNGLPDATLTDGVPPDAFQATLRPYQMRGLGWLQFLHGLGLGGCLADDMGLGKTPTTLAHLAGLPGPHLVVCPLSVVRNWEAETARFAPFMRVMVHHGTGRLTGAAFVNHVAQHDLVVTTYQVASRDIATIGEMQWSVVVLDEAQAVKNPETRTAKAMRKIPARQRLALTGTPVENRLSELWSILSTVTPGLLGSAAQFNNRFANPIERERSASATAALRQLTSPFLLRRTKADKSLVPDLPDKVEQIAWAPLTREQAHMYQAVVDQLLSDAQQESGMRRRGLVLAALTRLKQICNHPAHALGDGSKLAGRSGKLARFDELITDLLDAGEQALIFTQFREMGLLLQRHLVERFDQQSPFLHGGVSKAGRDRMVDQFQSPDSPSPLLLVSLKAGGTGLNLTAASRVVHYDRWWNPAVEDQATDRAWRIGQTRSVFVHKLVCEGTIEERVDALINDKRSLADAVVGNTGEAWLTELNTDALRDLVTLDRRAVRD